MPTPTDIGIDVAALAAPLVDLGFGMAGTARVSCTLHLIGTQTFNPATDAMSEVGGRVIADLPAMMWGEADREEVNETMMMLNASDLVAAGAAPNEQPKINDQITVGEVVWTIFQLLPVPTDTIYMMRVRR